ncbi:hypothetical protein BC332_34286 [Capsicum chinense]|nr:hypothetical protein BC332_34286 [Capsicum chinense]
MSSLPQSLSLGISGGRLSGGDRGGGGGGGASSSSGTGAPANRDWRMQLAEWLVLDLLNPDLRENALLELSKILPLPANVLHANVKTARRNMM